MWWALKVLKDDPYDLADSLHCLAVDPPLRQRWDVAARGTLR